MAGRRTALRVQPVPPLLPPTRHPCQPGRLASRSACGPDPAALPQVLCELARHPHGARFRRITQELEEHAAALHGPVVWKMRQWFAEPGGCRGDSWLAGWLGRCAGAGAGTAPPPPPPQRLRKERLRPHASVLAGWRLPSATPAPPLVPACLPPVHVPLSHPATPLPCPAGQPEAHYQVAALLSDILAASVSGVPPASEMGKLYRMYWPQEPVSGGSCTACTGHGSRCCTACTGDESNE